MKSIIQKNRYLLGILAFAVFLIVLISGVFSIDDSTNKMIVEYAENLGWSVEPCPKEISHFTIPEKFNEVFETYNQVQRASGFDFEDFKGKRVTRYVYVLKNHTESQNQEVFFSVIIYESRIIAGDISSSSQSGFMHGITEISKIKNL